MRNSGLPHKIQNEDQILGTKHSDLYYFDIHFNDTCFWRKERQSF